MISTSRYEGRGAFFAAARAGLPLDPPLMSSRSWDALSDSLGGGLIELGSARVVIHWPDADEFAARCPAEFKIARSILDDVASLMADPTMTGGAACDVRVRLGDHCL